MRIVILIPIFGLMSSMMAGVPIPGRWEKVERLRPGIRIEVQLKSGEKFQGAFLQLQPQFLNLRDERRVREFPRPSIAYITVLETQHDSVANGTLIGLGGGAAVGAGIGAAIWESGTDDRESAIFFTSLIGAGLGTLFGALADRSMPRFREQQLVYQAGG